MHFYNPDIKSFIDHSYRCLQSCLIKVLIDRLYYAPYRPLFFYVLLSNGSSPGESGGGGLMGFYP